MKARKKDKLTKFAASESSGAPLAEVPGSSGLGIQQDKEQGSSEIQETCSTTFQIPTSAIGEASVGSALHGSGDCRPCAWFWKPQECNNGIDCGRCHLCPDGTVKARKKAKALAARSSTQGLSDPASPVAQTNQAEQVEFLSTCTMNARMQSTSTVPVPPGLLPLQPACPIVFSPLPISQTLQLASPLWIKPVFGGETFVATPLPGLDEPAVVSHRRLVYVSGECSNVPSEVSIKDQAQEFVLCKAESMPIGATSQSLPSVGSATHRTGECDPCVWFWKPQGCHNNVQCCRCHLCPAGAAKARKKEKLMTMRGIALEPQDDSLRLTQANSHKLPPASSGIKSPYRLRIHELLSQTPPR